MFGLGFRIQGLGERRKAKVMAKPVGAVWKIQWSNPYTNPPEGQELVIAKKYVKYGDPFYSHIPPEFEADKTPGYGVYWSPVMKPSKQLPESTLKSIRRKRLERRVENKYPLFADEFIRKNWRIRLNIMREKQMLISKLEKIGYLIG